MALSHWLSFFVVLLAETLPAHAQTESVLYSFGSESGDGKYPYAALVRGKKGYLYGTTTGGGAYGYGTVFQITLTGKESVL